MRRSDGGGEPGRRLLVQEVRNDGVGWGFSNQEGGRAQSITLEGRAPQMRFQMECWQKGKSGVGVFPTCYRPFAEKGLFRCSEPWER